MCKGDQSWVFIGKTDAEAETPVLWPPHVKSWLTGKDSDAGRDWGQEEKGSPEDEMAGWHHWLDGFESEWTLGVCDGQGGLVCCDSRGRKESDTTKWLIWSDFYLFLNWSIVYFWCCISFKCTAKYSVFQIHILFQILFHYRLLQGIEYSSLCYTVGPCWLSVLCIVGCVC